MTNANPLDDTTTGRITQALALAAYTATPDYIHNKALRTLAKLGITTTALGIISYANLQDDNPDNDPQAMLGRLEAELAAQDSELSPAKTYLLLLGICLAVGVVGKIDAVLTNKITRLLRRAGVRKPHTLLGALAGVVVYAASTSEKRG
ncbi:hypothetical protein [Corynebacterium pelargi]|uniref:Uncharacterized protein n=1 Tax=Corynebacterium pelargi TaxID=1471400 RepID=A0A410W6B7_9CORY|nr:hypothetical protein [Corynebacterium pelargi]QAU51424.1 hypothetical protein CPELA_00600 [Corynebacterium pelargi]GGG81056.1 hypothetical protein GCM10007338_19590 [Corynebacterium pelargi]